MIGTKHKGVSKVKRTLCLKSQRPNVMEGLLARKMARPAHLSNQTSPAMHEYCMFSSQSSDADQKSLHKIAGCLVCSLQTDLISCYYSGLFLVPSCSLFWLNYSPWGMQRANQFKKWNPSWSCDSGLFFYIIDLIACRGKESDWLAGFRTVFCVWSRVESGWRALKQN